MILQTALRPTMNDAPKYAANVREALHKEKKTIQWFIEALPRYCPNESLRQSIIDALET